MGGGQSPGGGGGIEEAPDDGKQYGRQNEAWTEITGGGGKGTIGVIAAWPNAAVPDGWLECNGNPIPSQYTDLIALVGANTPDLRGEFVRGWDNSKGVDSGRAILSSQDDATAVNGLGASDAGHQHQIPNAIYRTLADGGANGGYVSSTTMSGYGYGNISVTSTDTETRPRNVALMYIICADGSPIGGGGGGGGGNTIINYNGASAWGNIAANGTLQGGLNVGTVTKGSTGSYSVAFTNPMPNANYSLTATANNTSTINVATANLTTTGFDVVVVNTAGNVALDAPFSFTVVATNALPPRGGTGADAWATHSGTSDVIESSFNVDTIARVPGQAVGHWRVTFTTAMPTNTYGVVGSCFNITASSDYTFVLSEKRTDGFDYYCTEALGGGGVQFSDEAVSFVVNATNAQLPDTVTQEQIEAAINKPGVNAWGAIASDGTLEGGLNVASSARTALGTYEVVFTNPMPNANYSLTTGTPGFDAITKTATGFTLVLNGTATAFDGPFNFAVHATNAHLPFTVTREQLDTVLRSIDRIKALEEQVMNLQVLLNEQSTYGGSY